jgi:hypothetical protein
MQHSLPLIPQKARNEWGKALQNFWAGSIDWQITYHRFLQKSLELEPFGGMN